MYLISNGNRTIKTRAVSMKAIEKAVESLAHCDLESRVDYENHKVIYNYTMEDKWEEHEDCKRVVYQKWIVGGVIVTVTYKK